MLSVYALWKERVTTLSFNMVRLEKRSEALKEENINLRKTEASSRELEEQCAKLKRRNAELANSVKVGLLIDLLHDSNR